MKVFDFDNTIYDGESSLDFFLFCLKRKKSLIRYMPETIIKVAKYKAGKITMDEVYAFCSKMLKVFLKNSDGIEKIVSQFWSENSKKLKQEILALLDNDSIIISASPRFLFDGIADKTGVQNIVCTEIDKKTQEIKFLCYGKNKVTVFDTLYPNAVIDEFYTDSVNDMPMIKKAKKAYMVKGTVITEFGKDKEKK